MMEETEERKAEKAEALKGMKKHDLRFLFWGGLTYLLAHFILKII
jgi:hypothetical protein